VLDATDKVLVPGYIDPHVHPAHVTTPRRSRVSSCPRGTTSVFADTLQLLETGADVASAFLRVADALTGAPLKYYWMIRPHAQSRTADEARRFPFRDLVKALAHPRAVAIGEVDALAGRMVRSRDLLRRLAQAPPRAFRRDSPRASPRSARRVALDARKARRRPAPGAGAGPGCRTMRPASAVTSPDRHRAGCASAFTRSREGEAARLVRRAGLRVRPDHPVVLERRPRERVGDAQERAHAAQLQELERVGEDARRPAGQDETPRAPRGS